MNHVGTGALACAGERSSPAGSRDLVSLQSAYGILNPAMPKSPKRRAAGAADRSQSSTFAVVIMAAGKGTRLKSRHPKVLHDVGGKPLLAHVVSAATKVVPAKKHGATRAALLQHLGLTQDAWVAYRESIVDYRNQMVAHHDLDAAVATYPRYDKALEAANFVFDRVRALADPNELGGVPTSLDRWSDTVTGNMSAIVRTAFAASAKLGSNVPG